MTGEIAYRLGEYRITVYDDVLLRWERHVPLGMARIGKCFACGDVLVIGKKSRDEDGFLIGEFNDNLRKLPPWTRTRYYCFAGELIVAATGQSLNDETLERSSFTGRNRFVFTEAKVPSPGTYRLSQYQITVASDHAVSWQAYGELNRILSGHCSIESGILIIGPQEHDKEGRGKQEFLDPLSRLPQWHQTMVWCRGAVLRLCQDRRQEEKGGVIGWLQGRAKDRPVDRKLFQPPKEKDDAKPVPILTPEEVRRYKEKAKSLLASGSKVIRKAWQRIPAGKAWFKWLALLIAALALVSVTAALYIAENWHHGFKKHHHKHHDH